MSDDTRDVFRENLLRFMAERNINQLDLAKAIGVSNTTINNWVLGYNVPKMHRLDDICRVLDISRTDLFEKRDNGNSPSPTQSFPSERHEYLFKRITSLSPDKVDLIERLMDAVDDEIERHIDT